MEDEAEKASIQNKDVLSDMFDCPDKSFLSDKSSKI